MNRPTLTGRPMNRWRDVPAFSSRDPKAFLMSIRAMILGLAVTMTAIAEDTPRVTTLEVVTTHAAAGDGGNGWGGHQCRIVRTGDGVFTAYTIPGKDDMSREWRLAWRREGKWREVAGGIAGREPVNLLASPDGTLHVIGWPEGRARWWSGKPGATTVAMHGDPVPGLSEGNWPYGSAGIDGRGQLCVLSSEGEKPGVFRWSIRDAPSGAWTPGAATLDYRYCYTYVFPDPGGGLSLVSSRDVRWETLGYAKPFDHADYVFNAFGWWRTSSATDEPLRRLAVMEEKPARRDRFVVCDAQSDAFVDTSGHMRIVYRRQGPSTDGEEHMHCAEFSPTGKLIADVKIPFFAGIYCRVFQDDRGQFYLLGSDGVIYGGSSGGLSFKNRTRLKLGWNRVEDAGFGISAPRGGTIPANVIDVVYPSGGGTKWIYARILLHGSGEAGNQAR